MTKNTAAKKVPRRSKRQQGLEVTPMEMKKTERRSRFKIFLRMCNRIMRRLKGDLCNSQQKK